MGSEARGRRPCKTRAEETPGRTRLRTETEAGGTRPRAREGRKPPGAGRGIKGPPPAP